VIPAGTTKAEKEHLIQTVIDTRIDARIEKDLDDMIGGSFK
jgi:hypothetical protein